MHAGFSECEKFVQDLDDRLEGLLFLKSLRDEAVVTAIEGAVDAHRAFTAKMLIFGSEHGWERLVHELCEQRKADGKGWEPRCIRLPDGRTIRMPQLPGKFRVSAYSKEHFELMDPVESEDGRACAINVLKALQRLLSRVEQDKSGLPAIAEEEHWHFQRVHLSGDAANYAHQKQATMLVLRGVGSNVINTQTPRTLQLLLYYIGHDDYDKVEKYGSEVLQGLRDVRKFGVPLEGAEIAPGGPSVPIRFDAGGDWPFHRTLLGLMAHPRNKWLCAVCKVHRDKLGDWVKCADGQLPKFDMRDINECIQLAHRFPPDVTAENFDKDEHGFTCTGCHQEFYTWESVQNATEAPDYGDKHWGQVFKRRPHIAGIVDDILDLVMCMLHCLMALFRIQVDSDVSIRYPASFSKERTEAVNAYWNKNNITFRAIEYVDTKTPSDWKRGATIGTGTIGADCMKIAHEVHWQNCLELAWAPDDYEEGGMNNTKEAQERNEMYYMWFECWPKLIDWWASICTPTKPGDLLDYEAKGLAAHKAAKAYLKSFKYTADDEDIKLYQHQIGHVHQWMFLKGNLLVYAGEAIESANAVMHRDKLATHMSNHRIEGQKYSSKKRRHRRRKGQRGRGLAAQLACAFFGHQDAFSEPAAELLRKSGQKRRSNKLSRYNDSFKRARK